MEFRIIIPARYESTRLPGKVLKEIRGKPMVQHVYDRAVESGADHVLVATDHRKVVEAVEGFGGNVCLTSSEHQSGTERLAEAVEALDCEDEEIVIGLQADEPLMPADAIRQLAESLEEHDNVKVASLCQPIIDAEELFNPHVVKVVLNRRNFAMYFSRAPIPWDREHFSNESQAKPTEHHYRHIGIYGYRAAFLREYIEWSDSPLESIESLEQLRILWHGGRILMNISKKMIPPGVDTEADLRKVAAYLK